MILTTGMGHAMESINGTARMNSIIVLDFADSASYCSQKDIGVKQLIKEEGGGDEVVLKIMELRTLRLKCFFFSQTMNCLHQS